MFGRMGRGGWAECLQGGGSGLNSLGALLVLQKDPKHDPNDYTATPLHFPDSTRGWKAVYTLLWSYMYTLQSLRSWLIAKAAVGVGGGRVIPLGETFSSN